jgi:ribosomal protein L11 methyltransferase
MIRLAVRVARSQAEPVLAELLELVPAGLEERDVDEQTVEYALYGAAGELPDVGELRAVAGGALVDVSTSDLPDGWEERWRDWHRPLDVGPLRVRAPWAEERPGALDVVIDPGQAFGTGAHPSTRLTLALLVELPRGGPLADWGCGSGILSVAAARLGFDPVLACDHERAAVAATLAAAMANGVPAGARPAGDDPPAAPASSAGDDPRGIVVSRCDLRREPGPRAPTVLANLVRPLLLEIAALMQRPPERLIASGLEAGEVDDVVAAFARHGLGLQARRDGDGWSAILLAR